LSFLASATRRMSSLSWAAAEPSVDTVFSKFSIIYIECISANITLRQDFNELVEMPLSQWWDWLYVHPLNEVRSAYMRGAVLDRSASTFTSHSFESICTACSSVKDSIEFQNIIIMGSSVAGLRAFESNATSRRGQRGGVGERQRGPEL
jgi:hypothetical protein